MSLQRLANLRARRFCIRSGQVGRGGVISDSHAVGCRPAVRLGFAGVAVNHWRGKTYLSMDTSRMAHSSGVRTAFRHDLAMPYGSKPVSRRPVLVAHANYSGNIEEKHIPLAEAEPEHYAKLRDFLTWYVGAMDAAEEDAASMERRPDDGAPDADDLQVELSWLVEDAVAGLRKYGDVLEPLTWRDVERRLGMPLRRLTEEGAVLPDEEVAIRASLADLRGLWLRRIKDRIPLQYLLGRSHWRDFILAVGPGCLIPRPETELLIDFAAEAVKGRPQLLEAPWADLGTGSGAIAVGIGDLLRQNGAEEASVWAVDASQEAAKWAMLNVERNQLQNIVKVILGNWGEPLEPLSGTLGGIISNPPYIPGWKLDDLQAEVGGHEPSMALDGGPGEGLISILEVLLCAAATLKPGGFLAIETEGNHQTEYLKDFLNGNRDLPRGDGISESLRKASLEVLGPETFTEISIRSDYRGIGRFLTCFKS